MSTQSLDARRQGAIGIDSGVVAIPNTSTWTLIGVILLGGIHSNGFIAISVGSADLLGIKLTRSELAGGHNAGTQIDWADDAYFDSDQPTRGVYRQLILVQDGPAVALLPKANSSNHIKLRELEGVQEIGVWGKSANASTLQVTGTFI